MEILLPTSFEHDMWKNSLMLSPTRLGWKNTVISTDFFGAIVPDMDESRKAVEGAEVRK
jgi:hypothetical protein